MFKKPLAFVRDLSYATVVELLALGAAALILYFWHHDISQAIHRSWHWLGRDVALPHWLLILPGLLAASGLLLVALVLAQRRRASAHAPPESSPPVEEAEQFRQTFVRFVDSFISWRGQSISGVNYKAH